MERTAVSQRPRRSLRQKILVGYLVLLALFSGVGAWAVYNFVMLSRAIDSIMVENYRSIRAAENMIEAIDRQHSSQLELLMGKGQEADREFSEYQSEFMRWFTRAEDNVTVPGEDKVVTALKASYNEYLMTSMNLRDSYNQHGSAAAWQLYLDRSKPKFLAVKAHLKDLLDLNHQAMVSAKAAAARDAGRAIISTIIVILASIGLGLTFGLQISNVIIQPTKALTETAKLIGEGQLDRTIPVQSNDEIGELAREFNKMTERLRMYEQSNVRKLLAEKRKSEAIVRSIADPVIVTDEEHRVVRMNPAAEKLFGTTEAAAAGRHFLEVVRNERVFRAIREAQENQGRLVLDSSDQYLEVKGEDKIRYYRIEVTPMVDENDVFYGVVTLLQDVTKLKEVDQMKSDFVSIASHEFRTPLTSISMSAGLLLENPGMPAAQQKELLEVIKEDTERLTSLVNDLLNLARIESGRVQMEFGEVDVPQLVEAALRPFVRQAEDKGITLTHDVEAGMKPVWADFAKISWVISNLIGNALRYTPKGGRIEVRAEQRNNWAFISVKDTGIGIPKEYQSRIFDKFVQVKRKDGNAEVGGAGLGLAICREIVRAHRGRIWVESEEGKGSTFTFTLPLATGAGKTTPVEE